MDRGHHLPLDVFSRRVVGWALEAHLRTVLMALDRAFAQRCPKDVIHRSDRGQITIIVISTGMLSFALTR